MSEKLDNLYTLSAPKWKDLFSKEVMIIDTKESSILNRLEANKIHIKIMTIILIISIAEQN